MNSYVKPGEYYSYAFTDMNDELKKFTLMNKNTKMVYTMSYVYDNKTAIITLWKDALSEKFKAKDKLKIRFDRPYIGISYIKLSKLGLDLEDIKQIGLFLSKFKPVIIQYKYKELMKFDKEKEV